MFEARIAEFEQLKRDIDEKLEQVQLMTETLSTERFEAWSQKRNVQAVVNGKGELLDVVLARELAGMESRRRLRNVVPTMVPEGEQRAIKILRPIKDAV
ncbi:YbaB/EbfC family nucleoid-associated protein [Allokutzneria sp. NRRL B-24872]|uniref:YbaB/EbfC family nucleoid-associated protein n=1 Tax=Allokutzneria sp. NRRL B-24872 TaxID=1137961 RepID=UPI000A3C0761|nr:YbaB/EbfC family nucleoid-associated protein [Allokutzneria sp. NRRL B-24872]